MCKDVDQCLEVIFFVEKRKLVKGKERKWYERKIEKIITYQMNENKRYENVTIKINVNNVLCEKSRRKKSKFKSV